MTNGNRDSHSAHLTPIERKFEGLISPFHDFIRDSTTGSILLIIGTLAALVIANSPIAGAYESLIHTKIGFVLADKAYSMSLYHWVNDGLMSLFFFVLGLEIKREILVGELRNPQQSIPVIAAAIGGMLFPAFIFYLFNQGSPTVHGWGIPMATDTAFAVGILALLGRRVPVGAIVFLTALAIIDDMGAIIVISIFYTESINLPYLYTAAGILALLVLLNALGFRRPAIYMIGGGLTWLAMLGSGVHATIAGILVAFVVPARPKRESRWFMQHTRKLIDRFEKISRQSTQSILGEAEQHALAERVQDNVEKTTTPLRRWENALETPVALFVMPVFALVNAGIAINQDVISNLWVNPLGLGIIFGLLVGKTVGISLFAWLSLRLGLGRLSDNVEMRHIIGIGLLGGMGFTMSIFISTLGFAGAPEMLVNAKAGILLASLIAGVCGFLWLRMLPSKVDQSGNK